jgi:pilus assembly protein CpaD
VSTTDLPTARLERWRLRRGALTRIGLAAVAAALAGCSTVATSDVDYDYRERHPIMVSEEPEVLQIEVGMNGPAISPEIERAIRNYVAQYRSEGTGSMTIQVPTGSANEIAAASTGRAVHYALVRAGVPHGRIVVAPYRFDDHARVAALRLSFLRVKAVTPRCGIWPERSATDFNNSDAHNFGCATQQNIAAMVANPADFMRPEPMGSASGARRAKVISDYGAGNETKSNMTLPSDGIGE